MPAVWSNAPLDKAYKLPNSLHSQEHTIVDLGEDEFTVGRLHPMLDNDLRIKRILQEAADPEVAVLLVDVVLGYGAHPDPAAELAPALAEARRLAADAGRHLEIVAVVVGTDADPQNMEAAGGSSWQTPAPMSPPPMKPPSPVPATLVRALEPGQQPAARRPGGAQRTLLRHQRRPGILRREPCRPRAPGSCT